MENSWYIRPYQEEDAEDLFKMMEKESDWTDYCNG